MKINILLSSNFFNDHCSYSFVYPIIKSIDLIKDSGIELNFVYSLNKNIFDCNILIIDSRFYGKIEKKKNFIEFINNNISKNIKLIFADTADNTGQIKTDFLYIADTYWKGQILKNKKEYMNHHYGGRLFTNYYYKEFNIIDKNKQVTEPVLNKKELNKIKVCWNMGLCDHGRFSHIKQKLFSIFKLKFLIRNSENYIKPDNTRSIDLTCRIGKVYGRKTVEFQRKKITSILKKNIETSKISRIKYLNEIKNSKFVISPFGWGELCPRDYETFLYGSVLIKPNMQTINTWPDWYIPQKTYLPFSWDISNLQNRLDFELHLHPHIPYQ